MKCRSFPNNFEFSKLRHPQREFGSLFSKPRVEMLHQNLPILFAHGDEIEFSILGMAQGAR